MNLSVRELLFRSIIEERGLDGAPFDLQSLSDEVKTELLGELATAYAGIYAIGELIQTIHAVAAHLKEVEELLSGLHDVRSVAFAASAQYWNMEINSILEDFGGVDLPTLATPERKDGAA